MICLTCAELKWVRRGASCPTCRGPLLDETPEALEQLVAAKLKKQLRWWRERGALDEATHARLDAGLPDVQPPRPAEPSLAARADALAGKVPESDPLRPAWLDSLDRAFRERDDWKRQPDAADDSTGDAAAGAGGALFGDRSTAALTGGLHALADLDEGDASLRSVIGEYVWWFIGTLLVLAGSVMGVREAWLALGGVPRLLVVAGALLAYHGGFVGLSSVVAKKSGVAGRVLGGIALTLLPVVFAALSALVALSLPAGVVAAAAAAGVCAFTLRTLGRRFEGDALALGLAFMPSLLAELPLSMATLRPELRIALPLASVAACGFAARRGVAALALGLYGLVALGIFTVVGAPGLPAVPLDFGSFGFAALTGWAACCAVAVAPALASADVRKAYPHAAPAAEVVALALAAAAGVSAFAGALAVDVGADRRADTLAALIPLIAASAFAVVRHQRRHAVHPAVVLAVLASMLVARLEWRDPAGWMLGPAAVAALLFVAGRFTEQQRDGVLLALWGALLGVGAVVTARLLEAPPLRATCIAAALVALVAHLSPLSPRRGEGRGEGAGRSPSPFHLLHYVGGAAALLGLEAWSTPAAFPLVLTAAAAAYLVAGRALRLHPAHDRDTWPLDDVSLAAALLAGALVAFAVLSGLQPSLKLYETAGGVAVVLFARAFVDRSRAVSFAAAVVLGAAVYAGTQQRAAGGAAALALAVLSLVRGAAPAPAERARPLLGLVRLPFAATGRLLWGDGFAAAALVFAALSALRTVFFLGAIVEANRPAEVLGAACTLGVALVAFFTRGFASLRARGHFATWCTAGGLVVLVALANRLGRPLPPQVVGLRFTFIVPALWLFAVALRRWGPRLARWLENESQGPLYHWVPHAGVAALGLLCAVEGVLVGGADPTGFWVTAPPLLFVAGALACVLLARSFSLPPLLSAGLGVLVAAAACAGAQSALLGPELAQVGGTGPWLRVTAAPLAVLVWERAARGVAVLSAAYAVLAALASLPSPRALVSKWLLDTGGLTAQPVPGKLLSAWSERAGFLVFAAALVQPRLAAAGFVVAAALLLRFAGEKKAAGRMGLFGGAALHAALAVSSGFVPLWAGPSLAAAGLAVIAARVLRPADADAAAQERRLARAHVAATLLGVAGLVWALATGGAADANAALPSVAGSSASGLWSAWPLTWAVPVVLALIAAAQLTASTRWTGALQRWTQAGATVDVALTLAAAVAVFLEPSVRAVVMGDFVWGRLVVLEGGPQALALAAAVVGAHLTSSRPGFALGRDVVGALCGVLLAIFIGAGAPSQAAFGTAGAALAALFVVSFFAAMKTKTGRHAWAAQVSVVGGYALVQAQWRDLDPALDAVFGLGFGFVLVGVTVWARRGGVAPVAKATRAFAALLPVVVALVFPSSATRDTALLAAASSLLYAVLATVEHNRFFGALAAVSANLALLVLALSQGLSGVEIFLAPLGLLLLVLAQLFKKSLLPASRNATRFIGGLLLYAPAAVKLSFQLGDAADATYAVVFGGVCLIGVAAGMLMQIRAYLAMGTLFLTLDVVANLVNAGLRDYRVGFVVLSAAGLLVLAAMVFATLKRDLVREWVRGARVRLRGWD